MPSAAARFPARMSTEFCALLFTLFVLFLFWSAGPAASGCGKTLLEKISKSLERKDEEEEEEGWEKEMKLSFAHFSASDGAQISSLNA